MEAMKRRPLTLTVSTPMKARNASDSRPMSIIFEVTCDHTKWGQQVYVVGADAALGSWSPSNAVQLSCKGSFPVWKSDEIFVTTKGPYEFKFVKQYAGNKGRNVEWDGTPFQNHVQHRVDELNGKVRVYVKATWDSTNTKLYPEVNVMAKNR